MAYSSEFESLMHPILKANQRFFLFSLLLHPPHTHTHTHTHQSRVQVTVALYQSHTLSLQVTSPFQSSAAPFDVCLYETNDSSFLTSLSPATR